MRRIIALLAALLFFPAIAFAASGFTTVTILDGGGTSRTVNVNSSTGAVGGNLSWLNTICDFTTITQCASVTSSNALKVDGSAVTQPISAASLPLMTGASTSALQGTNTATTAHTCSVAGFSELGCLGQVDDDIKGPIGPGTNIIGKFGIDQTTPGTTNAVQANVTSGGIASGAVASGAFASGAVASGAYASGSLASGAVVDLTNLTGTKAPGTAATDSLLAGGVYNSTAPTLTNGQQAALQLGPRGGLQIAGPYPPGATPLTASATGTTTATTATLTGTSSTTVYICWYSVRANATAATTVADTITGVISGTLTSELWVAPAASGLGVDEMIFNPCVPASGTNQAIAVVSGAPGSSGVVSVRAGGYYQ